MEALQTYIQRLNRLLQPEYRECTATWQAQCEAALEQEPLRETQKALGPSVVRKICAFFTGSEIANQLITWPIRSGIYFDPTCGAGDLLIAAARRLPVHGDLSKTLNLWGHRLAGLDSCEQFVELTKLRLVILALLRGSVASRRVNLRGVFPLIQEGDALSERRIHSMADVLLLNPPFAAMLADADCLWGSGKVNSAGHFLLNSLMKCRMGARLAAVLPEVLRSGARYATWRSLVENKSKLGRILSLGHFGSSADVHVFLLDVIKRQGSDNCGWNWWDSSIHKATLADYFDVSVGPVVPHRHKQVGRCLPFITARSVPAWGTMRQIPQTRRFRGTISDPPFVVIKRTSRPEDKYRAVATIIHTGSPVAVENHLVVCKPKSGSLSHCRWLLRSLQTATVTAWLNQRIQCRHLTVDAVKSLPLDSLTFSVSSAA